MTSRWDIYDALIDDLPEDVTVTASDRGARWTRVINSAGGIGSAWSMRETSRPALSADTPDAGRPIRDVAALVRSWNLAEASVGLAAINSWYSRAEVASRQGFVPTGAGLTWREVFDPYADAVEGMSGDPGIDAWTQQLGALTGTGEEGATTSAFVFDVTRNTTGEPSQSGSSSKF